MFVECSGLQDAPRLFEFELTVRQQSFRFRTTDERQLLRWVRTLRAVVDAQSRLSDGGEGEKIFSFNFSAEKKNRQNVRWRRAVGGRSV